MSAKDIQLLFVRLPNAEKRRISAVESVPGKAGGVWVVRGTRVPQAAIFKSLAQGYPFGEISEVFGLTLQQLMAVLQFAAEGFVLPPSAR